jgi:copper chaperone CopZ
MKKLLIIGLLGLFLTPSSYARTIEVEVHGMTCSFCVDALQRKFNKVPHITQVEVSLKLKKLRLQTDDDTSPTIEEVKQTVLDSGFTPVKIEVKADENK